MRRCCGSTSAKWQSPEAPLPSGPPALGMLWMLPFPGPVGLPLGASNSGTWPSAEKGIQQPGLHLQASHLSWSRNFLGLQDVGKSIQLGGNPYCHGYTRERAEHLERPHMGCGLRAARCPCKRKGLASSSRGPGDRPPPLATRRQGAPGAGT